ncbi:LysR family transcriptional regulator [Lysinibacillus sp. KU-BSD001]|uniref:LysR family transcriptional regulator n=1 Tax=Lysinibacillus sp. KU-BSD001 TaxID=3141328 RepID=UPI0036EED7A8
MDIEALKAFEIVAKYGSISQAADELNYSQSNVTAKIHKLEQQLNTTLLYRHNRGCVVTPKGQELLQYATQIFHSIHTAELAMQDEHNPTGELKLGAMETTAAVRLPKILANYHQQFPNVNLTLKTGPTAQLIEAVVDFKLDATFVSGPISHSSLQAKTVFQEEMVVVYPKGNEDISLEAATILVFKAGCSYRFHLESYLRHQGIKSYSLMEFGSLEAIIGCVAAGLGITMLPRTVYEQYVRYYPLQAITVPKKFSLIETQLIYRKENNSIPLQRFESLLLQQEEH